MMDDKAQTVVDAAIALVEAHDEQLAARRSGTPANERAVQLAQTTLRIAVKDYIEELEPAESLHSGASA
jgi:hypothetical protein